MHIAPWISIQAQASTGLLSTFKAITWPSTNKLRELKRKWNPALVPQHSWWGRSDILGRLPGKPAVTLYITIIILDLFWKRELSLKKLPWWKFQPAEYLTLISQSTLRYVTPNDYTPDMETMATKISHKVQEYRPPPPCLGIIPKNSFPYSL